MNYEDVVDNVTDAVSRYREHSAKQKHHQAEEVKAALDAGRYFALAKERVKHGDYIALVRRQGITQGRRRPSSLLQDSKHGVFDFN